MPWTDWQFWVVTVAAIVGLVWVARTILPRRGAHPKPATLTIEGSPAKRSRRS